jgi:hypothetical protein
MGNAFDDLVLRRAMDEYERQSMESANCGSPFDDWADAEEDERQEFIDYVRDVCMEVVAAWNTRTPSEAVLVEALEALEALILHFEDGENHNEGAFEEDCPDCQVLSRARAALASAKRGG